MIIDWKFWLVDAPPFVFVITIIFLIIGLMLSAVFFQKKHMKIVVCIALFAIAFGAELVCHFGLPSLGHSDGYDMARDMAFFAELIFLSCAVGCLVGNILINIILKKEESAKVF